MPSVRPVPWIALTLTLLGCGSEPPSTAQEDTEQGKLLIIVTVDWEGDDLAEENLAAMERLRERFPEVELVQFLNAAYFTKPGADAADVRARIARTLREGDEHGLHIHGWKRLFEAAGVTFRNTPTFWEAGGKVTASCTFDCGHEVPISSYTKDELASVIRFSSGLLVEQGFDQPRSFRAGGWMADENVREALVGEGFLTENSAVPATFLASEIGALPLFTWVDALWSGTDEAAQPYELETSAGSLLEIPDNAALADYVTADEMFAVYEAQRELWRADPKESKVLSLGFHQETADRFLPRVEQALERVFADAEENAVPVEVVTARELADRLER